MATEVREQALVKINSRSSKAAAASSTEAGGNLSRRGFLKILGAGSAVGIAGCADDAAQKIFPNVRGDYEQIPGVATWYSSTCTECACGCGIRVRTREGRAVKIEGNPENPVNGGGLCALGQASLQSLYDPDRIRQPLKRVSGVGTNAVFEPVSWDVALQEIATALKDDALKEGQKRAFITDEMSGALQELRDEWSEKFHADVAVYDALQPVALAKASEIVFGSYGIPDYRFDKAEVVVNFGADFLETWVSPVQFARDWAKSRKSARPVRVIQIEPRLSLTGANADHWHLVKPGTEGEIVKVLIRLMLERGRGGNLASDVRKQLGELVQNTSLDAVAVETGVSREKILAMAEYLAEAKSSLVIGGGAALSTTKATSLLVLINLLNAVLENVGTTIDLSKLRKPQTSVSKMAALIKDMQDGKVRSLFVSGTNPAFTLAADYNFEYAARLVPLMVSFSSHLDETAKLAHYILPANTGLESWGDVRIYDGFYSLQQPTMSAVFDTRMLGDILLQTAAAAGKEIQGNKISGRSGSAKFTNFKAFLEESWKSVHRSNRVGGDFGQFWKESVERGGYFPVAQASEGTSERVRVRTDRALFELAFGAPAFTEIFPKELAEKSVEKQIKRAPNSMELVLLPYPSVKSFDGRAANRPWLQEMADPITQIVWDSWAELHPDTAKKLGVEQGDTVAVRNFFGEVNVPVLITNFVRPDVVAVPLGQGHTAYGRFAQKVSGGNVYSLLAKSDTAQNDGATFLSGKVEVMRGRAKANLVTLSGSDSQMGRDIARTTVLKSGAAGALVAEPHEAHSHHHEVKQMYQQREHPLYEWGLTVDLAACTGCSACVVACYAENNIPVVGKERASEGREMSWLRIERYFDNAKTFDNRTEEVPAEELSVSFLPMMCQHCHNAPCEPVCPVYATYHNEEGLNAMVYNRCVGTRYCSNNCTYKVRRFNWYEYEFPEPLNWQLNPDVTKRTVGIMEKCTFCVQRIVEAKDIAKDEGRAVHDGEIKPACVQSCPTQALTFGNLKDPDSRVSLQRKSKRAYKVLDYYINTQPAVSYLERIRYEKA